MRISQSPLLGRNLKKLRKQANMKQIEVVVELEAYGIKMSRTKYVRIENGTHGVTVLELKAFTLVFGCDYNALFVEE